MRALVTVSVLLGAGVLSTAEAVGGSAVMPAPHTVTVQPGDTAYAVARRAGLSVAALLALNGLSANAAGGVDLRVGQLLRVRELPPHVVQPGETLYGLARRYDMTVEALLALNNLPAQTVLSVGQSLRLFGPTAAVASAPALPAPAPIGQTQAAQTQAVQTQAVQTPAVQTQAVQTPVAASLPPVFTAQSLPAPLLSQSQNLAPPVVPSASPITLPNASSNDWRSAAMALLGTPYVYGGVKTTGTDCSGFVLQVFTPLGVQLPRRSADQAQAGVPIDVAALLPGDLVFFDIEGRGTVSHVGIYLGNDTFVNANSYRGQVGIDKLMSDRYWAVRYLGARRVLPEALAVSR